MARWVDRRLSLFDAQRLATVGPLGEVRCASERSEWAARFRADECSAGRFVSGLCGEIVYGYALRMRCTGLCNALLRAIFFF